MPLVHKREFAFAADQNWRRMHFGAGFQICGAQCPDFHFRCDVALFFWVFSFAFASAVREIGED